MKGKRIIDKEEFSSCLERVIDEIVQKIKNEERIIIIGIKRRGEPIAKRIASKIERKREITILVGSIDITLYRDDFTSISKKPLVRKTDIPFSIEDELVILVDDVLYTGRTVRAALTELADFGRPKRIELAVLIDRGERELPISPDFVGKHVRVLKNEMVEVRVKELDGQDCVEVVKKVAN
jgi:pyrimidine operon attenuation protein/uracil phosphoribosyltransferase